MTCANTGGKWIRPKKRQAIYNRDDNQCVYCLSSHSLTLDHLDPQGGNGEKNIATACLQCNSSKAHLNLRQYLYKLRVDGIDTQPIAKRIQRSKRRKLIGYNSQL